MHSAVELILSRMKSNPDDFKGNSRWMQAVNDYKKHFTEEENTAVKDAVRDLRMTQLQDKLFGLMTEEEPREIDVDMYGRLTGFGQAPIAISGQPVSCAQGSLLNVANGGTNSTLLSSNGASWSAIGTGQHQHQAQLNALKAELAQVRAKQQNNIDTDFFKEFMEVPIE